MKVGSGQLIYMWILMGVLVLAAWQIFRKAGFRPWLSLFVLVPGVNLIAILYLAFADWPALKAVARRQGWLN